ncbi:MAG: diguanylate cyclase [Butyrivibrio sp.]|nr:diguanylate cyclase [Butyrivibrio sp.]
MSEKGNEGMIGYSSDIDFSADDILSMLRELPDACCIFKVLTDPFGTVKDMLFLFANEKYGSLVGVPATELVGKTYYDTAKNYDEDWLKFSYQAAILRQSSINRTYNSHFDKWFEFWAVPVFQKGFCAYIIHDVTAHKISEDNIAIKTNSNSVVIECAKIFASYDFGKAIKRVLKKLGQTIEADRVYAVKMEGDQVGQIYEWVSGACAAQLPDKSIFEEYDMPAKWGRQLVKRSVFMVDDTSVIAEKNEALYNRFLAGNISRYMVAALKDKKETIGFLVADNYSLDMTINAMEVFETVAAFISSEVRNNDLNTELLFMGSHDSLTNIGNRYCLDQTLKLLSEMSTSVGVCYTDINGLKKINDEQGHEAGDKLIKDTAELLCSIFKKRFCYRIGGDEFVAIVPEITREKFEEMVGKLKEKARSCSVAVGYEWISNATNINMAIKEADEKMYKDKADFYKSHERRKC